MLLNLSLCFGTCVGVLFLFQGVHGLSPSRDGLLLIVQLEVRVAEVVQDDAVRLIAGRRLLQLLDGLLVMSQAESAQPRLSR